MSLGYWNRPEDTARVLRPNPFLPATQGGEIVCWSGDLVVEDEDGFFTFVGRDDSHDQIVRLSHQPDRGRGGR